MKNYIYPLVGLVALVVLVFVFYRPSTGGLLSSADFINQFKNTPNAVMLDVRTPAEFDAGHIENAVNIDYDNPALFATEIKKLDPARTYFVYCRSGNRSSKAIVLMKRESINNIYELQGGIVSAPELLRQ